MQLCLTDRVFALERSWKRDITMKISHIRAGNGPLHHVHPTIKEAAEETADDETDKETEDGKDKLVLISATHMSK